MEEERNENELDERLYSMLHYADDTQENLNVNEKDVVEIVENAPRSNVRRYWRTYEDQQNVYRTVNVPNETPANRILATDNTASKSKAQQLDAFVPSPPSANLLSMFQLPVSQNLKKTIEIVENDEEEVQVVALESSDEDEVIEVELPPKPTITIESSDEDDVRAKSEVKTKTTIKSNTSPGKNNSGGERGVSASPVPSVVSSISDDFIRGDCIALNISSRHSINHTFDFSLHGSDLLTKKPSKKKKKKKNKDAANTSTPIVSEPISHVSTVNNKDVCFATPKSKVKNKNQKTKSYLVSQKNIPNPDVYDSDSNQSTTELKKNPLNTKTGNNITNTNAYVSESNQTSIQIDMQAKVCITIESTEKQVPKDGQEIIYPQPTKRNDSSVIEATSFVDLTEMPEQNNPLYNIDENIVMGNVSGFSEKENYEDVVLPPGEVPKLGSTKVPEILFADLDFNNLNGKEVPSKKRRYSLSTLRAEMEKFYNESWGGENFNHREIQKYMSRDKSLWVIDPKDRISAIAKRKVTCNYCNRQGHRDDNCRMKPPVCYMCGTSGHNEPRCPRKICVNCGSPNHMYSSMCHNCCNWRRITCAECGQIGHPSTHCPDLWRRYHNTISDDTPLEENHQLKKHYQMFCSGCTRRGHLVHTCRVSIPFSGLPINSPYVTFYRPVYEPSPNVNQIPTDQVNQTGQQDNTITSATTVTLRTDRCKRLSKSPVVHETHLNKKRNVSGSDGAEVRGRAKSPVNGQKRKTSQSKELDEVVEDSSKDNNQADPKTGADVEKAPDYIPISTGNRDKCGQVIQDNEVSDTSDVVTLARIYVTDEIMDKLNTEDGLKWLKETTTKNNVTLQKTDVISFLIIKGTVGDQEAFQAELRDWIKKINGDREISDSNAEQSIGNDQSLSNNIPKNRNNVLRVITKALDSLKDDLGDPKTLFKELTYLQNRHLQLLNQKAISPKQLSNNRTNMNSIFRKLNMLLLGQAGLADGPKHLNELCALYEKISKFRQKTIPPQMRQEIGQHFHSIFTAIPREDYADLLAKYYITKNTQGFSKNKKTDKYKVSPIPKQNKNVNQMLQINASAMQPITGGRNIPHYANPQMRRRPIVEITINKLVFYHRRLLNARPIDAVLKKTRMTLVNQLHALIVSLDRLTTVSPKTLKKIRKIQEQAQLFLSNV